MSQSDRDVDNRGEVWENIEFVGGSNETITVDVLNSGTETSNAKFLNLQRSANGFILRPTDNIQIISINGVTFRDPITVAINTTWSAPTHIARFQKIVIKTLNASTTVRLTII